MAKPTKSQAQPDPATPETAQPATGLPAPVARRGISEAQWRTLMNNLYPGAAAESVLMVWDYCAARKLDPLKKPCHIVPMNVKDAKTGNYAWRDVVMPGIYEYRTTAMRTGLYLGHSDPEYGPEIEYAGVTVPAWCAMTMYRWNEKAGEKVGFPVRVLFAECVVVKDGKANQRWAKAPVQMLTKCTEAAGLREAFPDELGGLSTVEEMEGRTIEGRVLDGEATVVSGKPRTEAPRAIERQEPVNFTQAPPAAAPEAVPVTAEAAASLADANMEPPPDVG